MNLSKTRVEVRSGSVGPRNDPYGWQEIEVQRNGMAVTLHSSALYDDWMLVEMPGHEPYRYDRDDPVHPMDADQLEDAFEKLTGYASGYWARWHEIAESRCPDCGKWLRFMPGGYLGEGFYVCPKCNEVKRMGEVKESMYI